jgi:hypothetical protein
MLALGSNLLLPASNQIVAFGSPLGRVVALNELDILKGDGALSKPDTGHNRKAMGHVVVIALEGLTEYIVHPGLGGSLVPGSLDD